MTIALLGATGRVGGTLAGLLLDAGHDLSVLVRAPERLRGDVREHPAAGDRLRVHVGDALDRAALAEAARGADVIVSALGGTGLANPGTMLSEAASIVVDTARERGVRRVVWVAASGILDVEGGGLRNEQGDYPASFRLITQEHLRVWETLRASGVEWTVVCPPYMPSGDRTGAERAERDRLPQGGRMISAEDVAGFLARELEERRFIDCRVGVAY